MAIGKPGVEFFSSWDPTTYFYDKALYANSEWTDLIDNVADAVAFVREQPSVDKGRIFLLGHSEGAHVAVDYAASDPSLAGLILLGYSGENLKTIVDWQLFHRNIDLFVKTDLDRQTPPFWATPLVAACAAANKKNCHVTLVPHLGHGFSAPRGPRFHPVANLTIGPVVSSFAADLEKLARELLPVVD